MKIVGDAPESVPAVTDYILVRKEINLLLPERLALQSAIVSSVCPLLALPEASLAVAESSSAVTGSDTC